MMGHREKIKTGCELDAISSACRRVYTPCAGVMHWYKKKLSRRARRDAKAEVRKPGQ